MKTTRTLFKVLVLTVLTLVVFACRELSEVQPTVTEVSDQPTQVGNRLSFKNSKAYVATLMKLDRMNEEQLKEWKGAFTFNSLESFSDLETPDSISLKHLSRSHQMVLNAGGEVIVGDTIVLYTGIGLKYYIPKLNETELERVRKGQTNGATQGAMGFKMVQRGSLVKENDGRFYFFPSVDARYQMPFNYRNDANSKRKFIFEAYQSWEQIPGSPDFSQLYLRVKLEWCKSNGSWAPAGENKFVSLVLNWNCYLEYGTIVGQGGHFTYVGGVNNSWSTSQNVVVNIGSDYLRNGTNKDWVIDIQGSAYMYVTTDSPYHTYNPVGYPLW